jgi:hypothetical protein
MKTILALLLLTFTAAPAEVSTKALLPDDKSRPNRAAVLLIGESDHAKAVQDELRDIATIHQVKSSGEITATDLETLPKRDWHAVWLSGMKSSEELKTALKAKLPPKADFVVSGSQDDAKALAAKIRVELLKGSTPWAELPKGEKRDPAKLLADDTLLAKPELLPGAPGRTATVFRAEEGQWQFNLHSFIAHHAGRFWAIWSSGRVDEDSSSQFIRFATSTDGQHWSESRVVAGDPDGENGPQRWLASGLYVEKGTLYALGCLNEGDRDGKIWANAKLVRLKWTAEGWKDESIFADNCMVYYPPLKVQGRDFFVWRDDAAHFFTARSLPQKGQWEVKKHPNFPPDYRLSETAAFADAEGTLHLIIRDQGMTKRLYHSLSFDHGDTWTLPVKTNYPDAVSKNFAGRLKDGTFFLINNPKTSGLRDPLTISFSRDGWTFSIPKILRRDSPARRYLGKAKGDHSFQYADAMEHGGRLHVIYAVNKEDIEISSYDLAELLKP